jgi:hypothetical protein
MRNALLIIGDGLTAVAQSIHSRDAFGYRASANRTRTKIGKFATGYLTSLRESNTIGYRAKVELYHTAKAVQAGIDSLANE